MGFPFVRYPIAALDRIDLRVLVRSYDNHVKESCIMQCKQDNDFCHIEPERPQAHLLRTTCCPRFLRVCCEACKNAQGLDVIFQHVLRLHTSRAKYRTLTQHAHTVVQ